MAGRQQRPGTFTVRYQLEPWPQAEELRTPRVAELHLEADRVNAEEAADFLARQTLAELRILGWSADGTLAYSLGAAADEPFYRVAAGDLPDVLPSFFESAWMLLSAEAVDAVALADRGTAPPLPAKTAGILKEPWRGLTAFAAGSFDFNPSSFHFAPLRERWLAKILTAAPPMGTYLPSFAPGPELVVGVRPASQLKRQKSLGERPRLLVSVPFFARGGVEHTLYETLRYLGERYEPIFLSLAPHSPELGDRRSDFETLGPRLFSFGDWLHPAAMPEPLEQLIEVYQPFAWYNANGTTLFYDLAPRIKARFPALRILDHLYDHRVGYIECYQPSLLTAIDVCVAENARIAVRLAEAHGWPLERSPVIWPCGRREEEWPPQDQWPALREETRQELGIELDLKVVLVAARMHEQKRPLDLPALAVRVAALPVLFLLVGGGPLENEVDAAISEATKSGAKIRRLPFRTDIPRLILAADAGCLVSQYEGLPIFLMECLQAGRPFLGTDVGALGDLLRETCAGWVVGTPGDLDALEAAVHELVAEEPYEIRRRKAIAAGPRFGVGPCAERYAAAFEGKELP